MDEIRIISSCWTIGRRYRYVIELGRTLAPMPEAEHPRNKVRLRSQVWLSKQIDRGNGRRTGANYLGDSDAHIVRGLIATC